MIGLLMLLLASAAMASQDCNSTDAVYLLPCNQDLDPWRGTREKMEALNNEALENSSDDTEIWSIKAQSASEIVTGFGKSTDAAEAALELAEIAGMAKKKLTKPAKALKVFSTVVQFVGPVLDLILLFAPASKSAELVAIEAGFAQMGAKIDSLAYNLEIIEDALGWNAVVSDLIEFEGTVHHTTEKYEQLVETIKDSDHSQELPLFVKGQIEELVNAIKLSGIGNKLQLIDNLFRGNSGFTDGKSLLEIFVDAVDNDCSKILPMASKIMAIVKDAQRLQFFYEINQQLTNPNDDKGYPKMIYDMYTITMMVYEKCTKDAIVNAQKELQVKYADGGEPKEIIKTMETKYDLYNWATMKENDKEEEKFALIDNVAGKVDVELTGISDDEKEEQHLTLLAVRKASKTQVVDAVRRVVDVLRAIEDLQPNVDRQRSEVLGTVMASEVPQLSIYENWSVSDTVRYNILNKIQNLLSRDTALKSLIDSRQMAMVMFRDESGISLTGWHFQSNIELFYSGFTLGFLFNFKESPSTLSNCTNGNSRALTIDGGFPYCLCNMGYGGEACDILLNDSPKSTFINTVLDVVKMYKVPGMFDLQDEIRRGTEAMFRMINDSKLEIFAEIRNTEQYMERNKNSILSAQSIMLNEMKMENAKVLMSISGLQAAMEAAFERERDDRIYRTEMGQKLVLRAISDSNKVITESIKRLTGRVIENRYFRELRISIPVYMEKYQNAITYGNFAERQFSEYFEVNEQNFQAAKEATKNAMLAERDSFVVAQMQINMVNGCTDTYTEMIKSTWAELMELHLAMTTMEFWYLDYKEKTSSIQAEIDYLINQRAVLKEKTEMETEEFKEALKSRSCPQFSLPDLIGGGCAPYVTYPGQNVPMLCNDPSKSLILISNGELITEVLCNENSTWAVNMEDLLCVYKCQDGDRYADIGARKRLPEAPRGFYYGDEEGNKVTESTCLAPMRGGINSVDCGNIALVFALKTLVYYPVFRPEELRNLDRFVDDICSQGHGLHANWSTSELIDINECADQNFCKFGGSCTNREGSFSCSCLNGYSVGSDGKCQDANECTFGGIGYQRCLVRTNLGTCQNTEGSYSCQCLSGSRTAAGGKQCVACNCDSRGVTYAICDGSTGACLCKDNVGGSRCERCNAGYTNYPYCSQCATGYHGYPNCRRCSCESSGVTSQKCDRSSGACLCKTNVGGNRCNECRPDYKRFPSCVPDVRDGTLSSWRSWSSWTDESGSNCGGGYRDYNPQRRTRRRACDDSTKNRHGTSCTVYTLDEIQTRRNYVCKRLTRVFIEIHDSFYAPTTGNLWMGIRQGDIQCTTRKQTWHHPGRGRTHYRDPYGCTKYFNQDLGVDLWLYSDTTNNAYVVRMGARVGSVYKIWRTRGLFEKVDHNSNNGWYEAS